MKTRFFGGEITFKTEFDNDTDRSVNENHGKLDQFVYKQ